MSDSPRERAAEREDELEGWRQSFGGARPSTQHHVELSKQRLDEARIRAKEAFERDAYRHYEAGAAYERAAEAHKSALLAGIGDVQEHQRAMEMQLEAARRELSIAQEAFSDEADETDETDETSPATSTGTHPTSGRD